LSIALIINKAIDFINIFSRSFVVDIYKGNIVDIFSKNVFPGVVKVANGRIAEIEKNNESYLNYILPGFVDSHIHIESSMLTPYEFGRIAATHGTVAVVADPHEIANVLGKDGIAFMVENGEQSGLKFYFGVPSCVPATEFETSGACLNKKAVCDLLAKEEFKFLSEMMNFPGVIFEDDEVLTKIKCAKQNSKPVDGHSPKLTGDDLKKYVNTGISTDHECETKEEAFEKIKLGMKILIREGSAAKNFNNLFALLDSYSDKCMFCSDDLHPDDLEKGHINLLVKRAVNNGIDLFSVLKAASMNPVKHYNLDVGLLQKGDKADFIVVNNLTDFEVEKTVVNGKILSNDNEAVEEFRTFYPVNNFHCLKKKNTDFEVKKEGNAIKVIKAIDGSLFTESYVYNLKQEQITVDCDLKNDILKIAVVNRYRNTLPFVGFVNGFGLKKGAIASSVAHDSHNIVAVGVESSSIANAVNLIIENKGGLSFWSEEESFVLPLPVGGIISLESYKQTAKMYSRLNKLAKKSGTNLQAPFMTLSFMALPVIPELKITDKGLFDVTSFSFTSIFK
jgi:adenine deaminase